MIGCGEGGGGVGGGSKEGRKVQNASRSVMQKVTCWFPASIRSCLRLDAYTGLTSVMYMLLRSTVLMT